MTLRWSYDHHANTPMGVALRPAERAAPAGSDVHDDTGFLAPISAVPIRAIDRVGDGEPEEPLAEVCAYHFGFFAMRPDGFLAPVVVTQPEKLDKPDGTTPRKRLSRGACFVAQRGEWTGALKPGFLYLIVSTPNPPWMAALYEGQRIRCGGIG